MNACRAVALGMIQCAAGMIFGLGICVTGTHAGLDSAFVDLDLSWHFGRLPKGPAKAACMQQQNDDLELSRFRNAIMLA